MQHDLLHWKTGPQNRIVVGTSGFREIVFLHTLNQVTSFGRFLINVLQNDNTKVTWSYDMRDCFQWHHVSSHLCHSFASGHNMLLVFEPANLFEYWAHSTNHHSTIPCFCCASGTLIRTSINSCCFQCFVKSFFSGFIGFLHVVSHSYIMYLILSVFSWRHYCYLQCHPSLLCVPCYSPNWTS